MLAEAKRPTTRRRRIAYRGPPGLSMYDFNLFFFSLSSFPICFSFLINLKLKIFPCYILHIYLFLIIRVILPCRVELEIYLMVDEYVMKYVMKCIW